jgi:metal transporter CNNM
LLIFLRVIPQAICNKYGLAIGASFAPFVRTLVYFLYPIAKPMAMLLDRLFGKHDEGVRYRKAELKAFVSLGVEDKLADDELLLLGNVLEFSGKTVGTIMTPLGDTYRLPSDRAIDKELIEEILRKGHTRIPVFEATRPGSFLGVMLLRALVGYDLAEESTVRSLVTQTLPQCPPDLSLVEAMNYFQTGKSHILLVSTHPGEPRGALGIVTLEDIVEELLGKEIIDETDRYVDMQSRIPVIRPRYPVDHSGIRRIFEGRFNRRRAFLQSAACAPTAQTSATGRLIDHPDDFV